MNRDIIEAVKSYNIEWSFYILKTFSNLHMAYNHDLKIKVATQETVREEIEHVEDKSTIEPQHTNLSFVNDSVETKKTEMLDVWKPAPGPEDVNPIINGKIPVSFCKLPKKSFQDIKGFPLVAGHILVGIFMEFVGDGQYDLHVANELKWHEDPGKNTGKNFGSFVDWCNQLMIGLTLTIMIDYPDSAKETIKKYWTRRMDEGGGGNF